MLAAAGCGVLSPEEQVLNAFFRAARFYDTAAMARVSAVTMNPLADGIVEQFEITGTAPAPGGREVVMVDAQLRQPDGRIERRALRVLLERREGRRWYVAEIARAPSAARVQ